MRLVVSLAFGLVGLGLSLRGRRGRHVLGSVHHAIASISPRPRTGRRGPAQDTRHNQWSTRPVSHLGRSGCGKPLDQSGNLVGQLPQKRQPVVNEHLSRQVPQHRVSTRRPPKSRTRQLLKRATSSNTGASRRNPRQRLPEFLRKRSVRRVRLTRGHQTRRRPPQLKSRVQVPSRPRHQPHRRPARLRTTARTANSMVPSGMTTMALDPQRRRIRHRTIVHQPQRSHR